MNNKHNIARTALTVALFGATTLVMAQKNGQVLKGRVVDTEGNPIPGAVVNVAEQSRIALTDKDGYFSLKGVKVADEINVQSVGYQNTSGDAILDGSIDKAPTKKIPYFDFEVPTALPGVDSKILDPRDTYGCACEWEAKAKDLSARFIKNFQKFTYNEAGKALVAAGPKL